MVAHRMSPIRLVLVSALALAFGCSEEPDKSTPPESVTPDDGDGDGSSGDGVEVLPTFFAASDVEAETLELISGAFAVADSAWFTAEAGGHLQFNPVYIAVVGEDVDAAVAAEAELCAHLESEHPDFHAVSRCTNPPFGCDTGVCYFAQLAGSTAASISSKRSVEGFHLMNLTADIVDYGLMEQVVIHESFHIFQLSHSTSTDYDTVDAHLGRYTADHRDLVPWWMEGVAEYMSVTTYGQEVSDDPDYVRTDFQNKLGYFDPGSGAQTVDDYFANGVKLYNIGFDDNVWTAYALGAWMVAWLVDQHGEAVFFDFYNAVDAVPFEDNFETHFGQDYRTAVDDFEVFLSQPPDVVMALWDE